MENNNGQFKKGERRSPATEFKTGEHWRPPAPFREKEYLLREYVKKQRSLENIATEYGVSASAISFWLRKHEIPRRTMSECRKIKHWGLPGKNNPMFGKRGCLSPMWKGGHTPERQACYSSLEWTAAVRAVWKRDKASCQRCGAKGKDFNYNIHHLVSFSVAALRCEVRNLILFCCPCHKWVHSRKNINKEYIRKEG